MMKDVIKALAALAALIGICACVVALLDRLGMLRRTYFSVGEN